MKVDSQGLAGMTTWESPCQNGFSIKEHVTPKSDLIIINSDFDADFTFDVCRAIHCVTCKDNGTT